MFPEHIPRKTRNIKVKAGNLKPNTGCTTKNLKIKLSSFFHKSNSAPAAFVEDGANFGHFCEFDLNDLDLC
jgi:hypothetical protein